MEQTDAQNKDSELKSDENGTKKKRSYAKLRGYHRQEFKRLRQEGKSIIEALDICKKLMEEEDAQCIESVVQLPQEFILFEYNTSQEKCESYIIQSQEDTTNSKTNNPEVVSQDKIVSDMKTAQGILPVIKRVSKKERNKAYKKDFEKKNKAAKEIAAKKKESGEWTNLECKVLFDYIKKGVSVKQAQLRVLKFQKKRAAENPKPDEAADGDSEKKKLRFVMKLGEGRKIADEFLRGKSEKVNGTIRASFIKYICEGMRCGLAFKKAKEDYLNSLFTFKKAPPPVEEEKPNVEETPSSSETKVQTENFADDDFFDTFEPKQKETDKKQADPKLPKGIKHPKYVELYKRLIKSGATSEMALLKVNEKKAIARDIQRVDMGKWSANMKKKFYELIDVGYKCEPALQKLKDYYLNEMPEKWKQIKLDKLAREAEYKAQTENEIPPSEVPPPQISPMLPPINSLLDPPAALPIILNLNSLLPPPVIPKIDENLVNLVTQLAPIVAGPPQQLNQMIMNVHQLLNPVHTVVVPDKVIAPKRYRVIIKAKDLPDDKMSEAEMLHIEETILNLVVQNPLKINLDFVDVLHEEPRELVFICGDADTADWLRLISSKIVLQSGKGILVHIKSDALHTGRVVGQFPNSLRYSNERILRVIDALNEGEMDARCWRVLNRRNVGHFVVLTMSVDKHAFDLLKITNGEIFYRFGKIKLEFY